MATEQKETLSMLMEQISNVRKTAFMMNDAKLYDACDSIVSIYLAHLDTQNTLNSIIDDIELTERECEEIQNSMDVLSEYLDSGDITKAVTSELTGQEQAEQIAMGIKAQEAAKNPLKYAAKEALASISAAGACLGSIKDIPSKMRNNVEIAKAVGLDGESALKSAAKSILSGAKDITVTSATKAAHTAQNVYGSAVEGLSRLWENAKSGITKAMYTTGRVVDTSLELVTLGGWSRLCDRMYKDGMYAGQKLTESYSALEQLNKLGYESDHKMFGKEIKDANGPILVDKANAFLSKAMFALHCKLTGDQVNDVVHQEYWGNIKQNIWGKDTNALEGTFGCTSPMDMMAHGFEKVEQKFAAADRAFSDATTKAKDYVGEKLSDAKQVAAEKADVVKNTVKNLPNTIREATSKAANFMKESVKSLGTLVVDTSVNLTAGSLRQMAKVFDKVENIMNNNRRKNLDLSNEAANEKIDSERQLNVARKGFNERKENKVVAQFDNSEIEATRQILSAATPTASIVAAIDILDKEEKKGIKKAEREASLSNMVNNLKNSGAIIVDSFNLVDAKLKIRSAEDCYTKSMEKVTKFEERAEKAKSAASKLRDTADQMQAKRNNDIEDNMDKEDEGRDDV